MSTRKTKWAMYQSPAKAREGLKRFTKERNYLVDGEIITPAEDWLINTIDGFLPVNRHSKDRGVKRRLIGIAKCLSLYPIPQWWAVRQRIKDNGKQGFDYGHFDRLSALVKATDHLLDDAATLEAYINIKGKSCLK